MNLELRVGLRLRWLERGLHAHVLAQGGAHLELPVAAPTMELHQRSVITRGRGREEHDGDERTDGKRRHHRGGSAHGARSRQTLWDGDCAVSH